MRYMPVKMSLIDDMFRSSYDQKNSLRRMRTDITEKDGSYLLDIELPGFNKEEISIELDRGYLIVSAEKSVNEQQKDNEGTVIRTERFSGRYSRSFYIGDEYDEEDIVAKYENGVLNLVLKAIDQKEQANKKTITIG